MHGPGRPQKATQPLARMLEMRRNVLAMHPPWLHAHGSDVVIDVLVCPRATRNRVMGVHDGRLKIQLAAPPVDGQANDALVRFLSTVLAIPHAQIEMSGGPASRRKTVRLQHVLVQRVLLALSPRPASRLKSPGR